MGHGISGGFFRSVLIRFTQCFYPFYTAISLINPMLQ